jgi:hypothetical protein
MGLALEFYLGDPDAIANAVADIDPERLDDPNIVTHSADLSLHINPADLDLLSESIGRVTAQKPQGLHPSLEPVVDEEGYGALLVAPDWACYVAALQSEQVPEVAELWASAMRFKHGDPDIVATSEMYNAIDRLADLCRYATKTDGKVVHVWYL